MTGEWYSAGSADPSPMRRGLLCVIALTVAVAAFAAYTGSPDASPLPGAPRCPVFPTTNVWNERVDRLPVAHNSAAMIKAIGLGTGMHPDFGSYAGYGIPINVVAGTQPRQRVRFTYAAESNKGPYPIPDEPKIEAGSDHHMLIVDRDHCTLFELYNAR